MRNEVKNESQQESKRKEIELQTFDYRWLLIFPLILMIWAACWWYLVTIKFPDPNWADRGQFGDMFGAVNALFSGFAFAGIIITIILQSKELKLQRDELKETRAEFEKQNQTLRIQRFENTFFKLLDLHRQVIEELYIRKSSYPFLINATGRDVIVKTNTILEQGIKKWSYDHTMPEWNHALEEMKKVFDNLFYESRNVLYENFIPYVRSMLRLLKYIENSSLISSTEKKQYYFIYYASVYEEEKTLLLYYLTFFEIRDDLMRNVLEFEVHNHLFFENRFETDFFCFHPTHKDLPNLWKQRLDSFGAS